MSDSSAEAAHGTAPPDMPAQDLRAPGPGPEPERVGPENGMRLDYDGTRGALAKIVVTNSLLTLATLGIYRFWGKTRVRRYLWGRVSFRGDRAEYTGTGRELLLGFLVAIAVLALLAGVPIAIQWTLGPDHPVYWAAEGIYAPTILFLVFVAMYRARRYRLSRTEWRGIRFVQNGSSIRYALLAFGWGVVTILSLGTAYAVYRTRLQRYRTTHTSFGNRRFEFHGRAVELLKPWLVTMLLLLPTLGIAYLWYRVKEFRYFAAKTRCGRLTFSSDVRAGSVIRVVVVYYVLTLLLLGLLAGAVAALATVMYLPEVLAAAQAGVEALRLGAGAADLAGFAVAIAIFFPAVALTQALFLIHPLFHEILPFVIVIGEEDYASIAQSSQSIPRQGEGLADALDVGAV